MKALDLAKYIICISHENKSPISNLQLQKVLYFVNMFYIAKTNNPLIDDDFEAWQFGPVIKEVYNEYSINGSNKIYLEKDENYAKIDKAVDAETKEMIIALSKASVWKLVDYSHRKNGPWDKTFDEKDPYKRDVINYEFIKDEALKIFQSN